jgi:arylsulfatase A-like enzyme
MEAEVSNEVPFLTGNEINKKVGEWLSSHIQGRNYRPFFLWLHYMDAHEPYMPEKEFVDTVDSSIHLSREEMFHLFKDTLLKRDLSDKGKVESLRKLYLARVQEVDAHVKDFYSSLERLGLVENSIIIMTADHGDEFGEHGGLSHDGKMYRELINVPFLIYDHVRKEPEISAILLSGVDIPPTIVHLFGLDPEETFEGHSIFPLEDYPEKGSFGEAIDKRSVHEKETDKPIYYYQRGDLKIIYRESVDSWELYDLEKDPKELDNIVDTSPQTEEMKKGLRPRIRRWLGR